MIDVRSDGSESDGNAPHDAAADAESSFSADGQADYCCRLFFQHPDADFFVFDNRMTERIVRGVLLGFISLALLGSVHGSCEAQVSHEPEANQQQRPEGSSFAIVRVRLSPDSEADDWGMGIRGHNFWAVHVTVNELIGWAYGLNSHQINQAPEWLATERFDVDGLPEDGVQLSSEEYRLMLRAALADRFALTSHPSERALPVYVLSVASGGIKLVKTDDQAAKSSWGVHRGWLSITNMTFDGAAKIMQRTVFDRPVLDRTGHKDRYSFILKWRPDETQFTQMLGVEVPQETGTEDVDDIFTSARKQLGIRIEARKEIAPTMVIDSVSKPSSN